jgi:hypothetical protein
VGIDLKVMASYFRERATEFLPTATVRFERDIGLFAQLTRDAVPCLVRPLPQGMKVGCYDDDGLHFVDADRQGEPLTFATPADLRRLHVAHDIDGWNTAVLAFLRALPTESRVVLYWC